MMPNASRLAEELRLRKQGMRPVIVIGRELPRVPDCGHAPRYKRLYAGKRRPVCLMCLAERRKK